MSDLSIPYSVRFSSRSKRLTIRVDGSGEVIVTAPRHFPSSKVVDYVESARGWITAQQAVTRSKPKLITPTSVYFFGEEYSVRVSRRFDGSVTLGKKIILVAPLTHEREAVGRATCALLSDWLKSRAIEYITTRIYELATMMRLTFSRLAFKQQKTRWGSCSSQKNLNFNWKLIHAPKAVIDYVLIHELAHTRHMDHGRNFWDLVSCYDPDHAVHRRWLARFGSTTD